jgi:hypothetical protein
VVLKPLRNCGGRFPTKIVIIIFVVLCVSIGSLSLVGFLPLQVINPLLFALSDSQAPILDDSRPTMTSIVF